MNIETLQYMKRGKLFEVKEITTNCFTVKVNDAAAEFTGADDAKKFESYLRKSFRHFYNLDKSLKPNKRKGRLVINKL